MDRGRVCRAGARGRRGGPGRGAGQDISASPRAASTAVSAIAPRCSRPCWRAGASGASPRSSSRPASRGAPPRDRLKALIQLYSERMNTEGMAIELAIRQWARSDEAAAAAVSSVDAARLKTSARPLPRDRPRPGRSRRGGLPVLLLHLRPEPVVSRPRPAQTRAADRRTAEKLLDDKA